MVTCVRHSYFMNIGLRERWVRVSQQARDQFRRQIIEIGPAFVLFGGTGLSGWIAAASESKAQLALIALPFSMTLGLLLLGFLRLDGRTASVSRSGDRRSRAHRTFGATGATWTRWAHFGITATEKWPISAQRIRISEPRPRRAMMIHRESPNHGAN